MPHALIFQPAKTAMQSGQAKTHHWRLTLEREKPFFIEPLMGWVGSSETSAQVHLAFPTKEAAVAFAEKQGWKYSCQHPVDSNQYTVPRKQG